MTKDIRIFSPETDQYKRLSMACGFLNQYSTCGVKYSIQVTHFDYGQNWKWTTVLALPPKEKNRFSDSGYQLFTPAQQTELFEAETIEEFLNVLHKPLDESNKRGW